MEIAFTHASVVLPDRILEEGAVLVRQGAVAWVGPTAECPGNPEETIDLGGFYLAPGLIDLHLHGGGGQDAASADPAGLETIRRTHLAGGTTALCLSVVPSPPEQMRRALGNIHRFALEATGGARVLGAHIEGPFVNPTRLDAAQERWAQDADLEALKALATAAGGWLRIVTLAPELPGCLELIRWLSEEMGLVAAIGHTSATCEQTEAAISAGARLATHLFNSMKPFHHRDPNAAGAFLAADGVFAELVVDGVHLHPAAVKLALRALGPERLVLVTDATAVAGAADGQGELGGRPIRYQQGVARYDDGQVAGSALHLIDAVRNLIDQTGLAYPLAVRCASLNPARVLGIDDRLGSVEVGKHADLLVLDKDDLRVLFAYVGGERVYRSPY